MSDADTKTRVEVYHGLVHCIVTSPSLWSTVDVADVKEIMAGPLAAIPEQPLLLQPLWDYMRDRGAPRDAATETLVFFHSRAERFAIRIALPRQLEALTPNERATIVAALSSRGASTGTHVGTAEESLDCAANLFLQPF